MKKFFKTISLILCFCMLLSFPIYSSAASSGFEKSIANFPESYKVRLRELHKDHPNWEFVPLKTGIKWDTAVNSEMLNGRSLVSNWSAYTDYFKSKESGDYNYSTEKFIEKDGGFVTANKMAVSYFMDPRNSLNEENIFQFEDLSFDESFTVEAISVILSGAYCPPEYKSDPTKYYKVIYNAGKSYNVNPCYLAAKIKNEIGTGSASVYGKNSSYPGIYNFYNIGATDGAGAITRGLAWASSGSTYHRPWTTAKKSIVGGAEFIASNYVSEGQYTGYLQKFNVNPNSSYGLYNHQYMTNISGSMSQGYSTYLSYLSIGIIDNYFKFSIPVFEDMPGSNDDSGSIYPSDAASQKGNISVSYCNVRKGPSTNNDLYSFQLSSGTNVTILDCVKTDSRYYDSFLRYPFWYHIKFNYGSSTYRGYVPSSFVTVSSTVDVKTGSYTPKFKRDNSNLSMKLLSFDTRYATISEDKTINFISKGSVDIGFYDSVGRFRLVRYKISKSETQSETTPEKVTGVAADNITASSFSLSWNEVPNAAGYRVYLYDKDSSAYKAYLKTSAASCEITGLAAGEEYKVKVKAYSKTANGETLWGSASSALAVTTLPKNPDAPKNIKQSGSSSNFVNLKWDQVKNADGYDIYMYDANGFKLVTSVDENSCTVSGLSASKTYKFKIKSYFVFGGKKYSSSYSAQINASTGPSAVTGLSQASTKTSSFVLKWNAVKGASGYKVYSIDKNDYSYSYIGKVTKTEIVIDSLDPGELCAYSVVAFSKSNGETYCSSYSDEILTTTLPSKVKNIKQSSTGSNGYTLKWDSVKNASGYCVYKMNSKGVYKKIDNVKTNQTVISSLKPCSTDKFKIRAYIRCNGKVYWGAYSSVFSGNTSPVKVTGLKKTNTNGGGYKLSWTKVSGATGYKVCIYDSSTKKYSVLATTKTNYINITSNESMIYAIRAYRTVNKTNYYGSYSSRFTVKL